MFLPSKGSFGIFSPPMGYSSPVSSSLALGAVVPNGRCRETSTDLISVIEAAIRSAALDRSLRSRLFHSPT